eukprot:GFYU01007154.1.p1 GENE.GFYU01007154.1~~GFYU01007154.1.p1  ORF type:complete len:491 (-),score=125.09 GFYU01007154.1:616-2088(-)
MVEKGRVVVYSITSCGHCRKAKTLLKDNEVEFCEVNLDKYPGHRKIMTEKTGGKTTVPQIFFNGEYVGNGEALGELAASGDLLQRAQKALQEELSVDAPPLPTADESATRARVVHVRKQSADNDFEELRQLAQGMRAAMVASGAIANRRSFFTKYRRCFAGRDAVKWLMSNTIHKTKEEAVSVGKKLMEYQFMHHVKYSEPFDDGSQWYRFQVDAAAFVLNMHEIHHGDVGSASEVSERLRMMIAEIYGEFLAPDGSWVDYEAISKSTQFAGYKRACTELQRVDIGDMTRPQKVAFFINVYNALVIHAFVEVGPATSDLARMRWFNKISYTIGGLTFSLNDIENGILRGNRKAPYTLSRQFSVNDPRKHVILTDPEPRVHFALVCGAKSCPSITVFTAEEVDSALDMAAEAFLDDDKGMLVEPKEACIRLSKIFYWYSIDFGRDSNEILATLLNYMQEGKKKDTVAEMFEKGLNIKYQHYDWSVNAKPKS